MNYLIDKLNEPQRQAVLTTEGPLLVLAGAGSGKTRVITHRIAHILNLGCPSSRILAVTFTNKASQEMRERIRTLVGPEKAADLRISTFHSFGLWMIRHSHRHLGIGPACQVMDESDRSTLIRQIRQELGITEKDLSSDDLSAFLMAVKGLGTSPQEAAASFGYMKERQLMALYENYSERLRLAQVMDFDDLILLPVHLLTVNAEVRHSFRSMFDYILVDEYQDTNLLQFQLLKLLVNDKNNLCVVGDDDQSIYGWRGARIENILEFEGNFPNTTVIKLTQNYRSQANILEIANALISRNQHRKEKELWTSNDSPSPALRIQNDSDKSEASNLARQTRTWLSQGIPPSEIAVLFRTRSQARVLQEAFRLAGIPYRAIGSFDFFDRKEIRDFLAYLRLCANPADETSFRRVVNYPVRGVGLATLQRLDSFRKKGTTLMGAAQHLLDAAARDPETLAPKTARDLKGFVDLISRYRSSLQSARGQIFVRQVENLFSESGMMDDLAMKEGNSLRSVQSLLALVAKGTADGVFNDLNSFLERITLQQNEADYSSGDDKEQLVTLMTIHSAKGLEFQCVLLAGLVDGLFPHSRSVADAPGLEEERRLFYVAITRAKKHLMLSSFFTREERGEIHHYKQSRFLREIPSRLVSEESPNSGTLSPAEAAAAFDAFDLGPPARKKK